MDVPGAVRAVYISRLQYGSGIFPLHSGTATHSENASSFAEERKTKTGPRSCGSNPSSVPTWNATVLVAHNIQRLLTLNNPLLS